MNHFLQFPTITVCPNSGMSATSFDYTADLLDLLDHTNEKNRKLFSFIGEALYSARKGANRKVIR